MRSKVKSGRKHTKEEERILKSANYGSGDMRSRTRARLARRHVRCCLDSSRRQGPAIRVSSAAGLLRRDERRVEEDRTRVRSERWRRRTNGVRWGRGVDVSTLTLVAQREHHVVLVSHCTHTERNEHAHARGVIRSVHDARFRG